MESKSLLFGIIGFIAGGLIIAIAVSIQPHDHAMDMNDMTSSLQGKTGDDFDKTFLSEMITHHQGAVDMARLAAKQAKHDEVKLLAADIISTQNKELDKMRTWQKQWDYGETNTDSMSGMSH